MSIDHNFLEAVQKNDIKNIQDCLDKGANINARDAEGRTGLHIAAWHNWDEVGQLLLARGANIEAQMCDSGTPLHDAVAFGSEEMVRLLLDNGANILARDERDWTVLFYAITEGKINIARTLLAQNPELAHLTKFNKISAGHLLPHFQQTSIEFANLLLEYNVNLDCEDDYQCTPLHEAAKSGHLELTQVLVQRGSKVFKVNVDGFVPEELANQQRNPEVVDYLQEKVISRQKKTEKRFFDKNRNLSTRTTESFNKIYNMLITPDNPQNTLTANGLTGRHLITAESTALKSAMNGVPPEELRSAQSIAERTQIHNAGYRDQNKANFNWPRLRYHYSLGVNRSNQKTKQKDTLCSQQIPLFGHLGNCFLRGIGKYGEKESQDIMQVIYTLTKNDLNSPSNLLKEQAMASLFRFCLCSGTPITVQLLKQSGLIHERDVGVNDQILSRLNRIWFLTGIKEVSRRMLDKTVDLPLALAYIQGLHLVEDGYLSMQDLFADNAIYGLPTASKLQEPAICSLAKQMLIALNVLFAKTYPQLNYTCEDYHQLLIYGFGGADESEGLAYESLDDEGTSDLIRNRM
ncbi:MAG: ankyrin repeat domain-containing protein [Tatlockia sp.]|nr:ankyrin repeat domain-containing protein [Tatlockia sp.]